MMGEYRKKERKKERKKGRKKESVVVVDHAMIPIAFCKISQIYYEI